MIQRKYSVVACIFSLILLAACQLANATVKTNTYNDTLKPRVVVLTDIAPVDWEPDDLESLVRLLAHADLFEIEAIIVTGGWNSSNITVPTEWIDIVHKCIDAYEQDLPNLMKRSSQSGFLPLESESERQAIGYWPSADYLRSRTMFGSLELGTDKLGKNNDSRGSDFIIQLADENDTRPLWILAWGGANTLSQAIWKVRDKRNESDWRAFLRKLCVYTITDQDVSLDFRDNHKDSSHHWMRKVCGPDLLFIWDESAWMTQNSVGSDNWNEYAIHIQNHGHLGKIYPKNKYGVEGDTPSFLHVMPNGLNDPARLDQTGWGGFFKWAQSIDNETWCFTNYQPGVRDISQKYEHYFYPAVFANFAARMDWAKDGKGNRNPTIVVNGQDGLDAICLQPKPGSEIVLDASQSYDEDGDSISYKWWILPEAGTYAPIEAEIANSAGDKLRYTVPSDAGNKTIHIICEATDSGTPALTSYRRIILEVSQ